MELTKKTLKEYYSMQLKLTYALAQKPFFILNKNEEFIEDLEKQNILLKGLINLLEVSWSGLSKEEKNFYREETFCMINSLFPYFLDWKSVPFTLKSKTIALVIFLKHKKEVNIFKFCYDRLFLLFNSMEKLDREDRSLNN